MAGRKPLVISARQFEVLGLLWDRGPMTVRELLELLPGGTGVPYTTVLGLLQSMERAGLVTHDAESQAHRYRPLLSRQEATGSLLADFVKRFFRGSAERLVLSLVDTRQLSPDDLRQIEAQLGSPQSPQGQERPSPRSRKRRGKP